MLAASLCVFGCSVHFLFSFFGHVPSQQSPSVASYCTWTKIQISECSVALCDLAPPCLSYLLPHHSLCFVTLGSSLFLKRARLFPAPGPLHLLFTLFGIYFFIFPMADLFIHQVAVSSKTPCLTSLFKDIISGLCLVVFITHPFFFPLQGLLHYTTILLFLCFFHVCLLSRH